MAGQNTSDTEQLKQPMSAKIGLLLSALLTGFVVVALVALVNLSRNFLDFPSSTTSIERQLPPKYEGWQRESFLVKGMQTLPELLIEPVVSSPALKSRLQEFDLWDIQANASLAPVIFDHYPSELNTMALADRKKIFFHTLLPAALVVQTEIALEKRQLERIIRIFQDQLANLVFDFADTSWQQKLNSDELTFLRNLVERYRTERAVELLYRVDVIPISIVLAQGALESSWGSSRFAKQGNNIFGMWTWGNEGMVPNRRDQDKTHKVAIYPSLIDSVRTHSRTINIGAAYSTFRNIRKATLDPFQLAGGLLFYAERGQEYVEDIKTVIRVNNLKLYDTCYLQKDDHI